MNTRLYKTGMIVFVWLIGLVLATAPASAQPDDPTPVSTTPSRIETLVIGDADELSDAEREEHLKSGLPVPTTIYLAPDVVARLDRSPVESPASPLEPRDFVDNWEALYSQDFEGVFPDSSGTCQLIDADSLQEEYLWGNDNHRSHQGSLAAWPAKGGTDGLDPASNHYPDGMKTLMICGPFDLSQAHNAMTEFALWFDLPDLDDTLFFGVSGDGVVFEGLTWSGSGTEWVTHQVHYPGWLGDDSVWVMWQFESDASQNAEGPWLDDIIIWRYVKPTGGCDIPDPGGKGLNLPPYMQWEDQYIPLLKDASMVDRLDAADVGWVRLEFMTHPGTTGGVSYKDYDLLVDTLCAHEIPVLGLVDYQTLKRRDWNTNKDEYRAEFNQAVSGLVEYFDDRIGAWEVWNEPDYSEYYVNPDIYAELLATTYDAIKATDPGDLVVFGGLGGADSTARDYLVQVYNDLIDPSPFDVFALHPYISTEYRYADNSLMLDPRDYMHYEPPTIIQKFLNRLTSEGDGDKEIWATELGWNSARGVPEAENCAALSDQIVSETEQAGYLTAGFDILFNEPEWSPGSPAITKIFWYQFRDTQVNLDCGLAGEGQRRARMFSWDGLLDAARSPQAPTKLVPWSFGLHDGVYQAKLAQCHYRHYPDSPICYKLYLPVTVRNR